MTRNLADYWTSRHLPDDLPSREAFNAAASTLPGAEKRADGVWWVRKDAWAARPKGC
jgi:hypothetical protein